MAQQVKVPPHLGVELSKPFRHLNINDVAGHCLCAVRILRGFPPITEMAVPHILQAGGQACLFLSFGLPFPAYG